MVTVLESLTEKNFLFTLKNLERALLFTPVFIAFVLFSIDHISILCPSVFSVIFMCHTYLLLYHIPQNKSEGPSHVILTN